MSVHDLSVLVVDEDRFRASIIEDGLREAGHTRVRVVRAVALARTVEELAPDVVVIDLASPDRDLLEHLFALSRAFDRPVAMFVDRADAAEIEAAVEAGVAAYVVDGLRKERIKPILDMAVARFNAFTRLKRERDEARAALEDRRVVDRAKAMVMQTRGLGEDEAYALLRRTAMNQNRRVVEVARSLVTVAGLLEG